MRFTGVDRNRTVKRAWGTNAVEHQSHTFFVAHDICSEMVPSINQMSARETQKAGVCLHIRAGTVQQQT